jgi:hypothetical protein
METEEIYDKAKDILKELSGWSVLDSMLVLEVAKQQLMSDTIVTATKTAKKK